MRILVVDTDVGLDLLRQLANSGGDNHIYYFNNWMKSEPHISDVCFGEGFLEEWGIEKVDNYWHLVEDVDLIIFPFTGWGDDIDFLVERGYKVFGACKAGEELENDRMAAKKICKEYELDIPETIELNVVKAIEHIKDQGGNFVIKFSEVRDGKFSTYVPVNREDCLSYLNSVATSDRNVNVTLEKVVDGVECGISGFFNGKDFVEPFCVNFEHKHLMDGELGPSTGEMGTLLFYTSQDLPFIRYFKKIAPYLQKIGYHGIIDMNCITNEEGYWVTEFTSRFGFPLSLIQPVLHEDSMLSILNGVANGTLKTFNAKEDVWALGLYLVMPGYPYKEHVERLDPLQIFGVDDAINEGCHLGYSELVKREGKYFTLPHGSGEVLVINGVGNTIDEARDDAYRAMDYISFRDVGYRLDIGLKIKRRLQELYNYGVIPRDLLRG